METQVTGIKRFRFLDVPVDSADDHGALRSVDRLAADGGRHHVVLLTLRKLMRARRDIAYFRYVNQADLILPVSRGIVRGASFQKKPELSRFNPFDLVIRLLTMAEENGHSLYILGARKADLLRVEGNLRTSFPKLRIVGRYSGYFNRSEGRDVLLAIKKASPALLLVGSGVPGGEKWISQNSRDLAPGVSLWVDDCFEVFAGKAKRTPPGLFASGLESLPAILTRPWQWLKIFPFLYFKFLVLAYRMTDR